jgi:hypothetical protein
VASSRGSAGRISIDGCNLSATVERGIIERVGGTRVSQRARRDRRARRNAQLLGLGGFLGAAALPFVLWHRPIAMIAHDFRFDANYLLTGWLGYGMIAAGLLFFVPVLLSIGRNPESRLYPRQRNALLGWGVSLYLLGIAIAVQVAAIARGLSGH